MKRQILLAQVNNLFGRNCFLPYSVGCLQAYAQAQPDLVEAYEFLPLIFLREDPQVIIARTPAPDVIGFSSYIWNEQWCLAAAKAMKEAWPHCLIVFGGPQVPERDGIRYLERHHPAITFLVHGEGEIAFAEILRRWAGIVKRPCYEIPGVQSISPGMPPKRIDDLSVLPSPYLSGVFDSMPWAEYDFHATQETHRGCIARGTLIQTLSATKPIEAVQSGEFVLGWNERLGAPIWNRVEENLQNGQREVLGIYCGGKYVEATADHPFYSDRGWIEASSLRTGDRILCDLRESCAHNLGRGEENAGEELLAQVRRDGEDSMEEAVPRGQSPPMHSLWEADLRKRERSLPKNMLAALLARACPVVEDRKPQSSQASNCPSQDFSFRQKAFVRAVEANHGAAQGWSDSVSSPESAWPKQIRGEDPKRHLQMGAAISVRGGWSILDRSGAEWQTTQSGLHSSPGQEEAGGPLPGHLLAYPRPSGARRVHEGLRRTRLADIRDLGYGQDGQHLGEETGRFQWLEIDSIGRAGRAEVYDLSNAKPWPNFFANGFLVHNCPFACTFCDWGSAIFTKVRAFDDTRIQRELHWIGHRDIDLLYNADANYGLLPRDLELTQDLVNVKHLYGYPKQFRAAYAKNANEKIFQIASVLHEAGMSKGITLSLQSTDAHTLEVIKRKNIAMEDFEGWVKRYQEAGIGTYTELILGLPGETYDTFADGIDRVLSAGQHHGLHVYLCMALPNSELSDPAYAREHGIRTVRGPLLQQHATPDPTAEEMADIVIATKTMPEADWLRAFLFSWAVQTFHCLGLTTQAAIAAAQSGSSYRDFYEGLLDFAVQRPSWQIGSELLRTTALAAGGMRGDPWGTIVPAYGDVIWPPEEASFLWLVGNTRQLYTELVYFIDWGFEYEKRGKVMEGWDADTRSLIGPTDPPYNGDTERYGRERIWQGRKAMKHRQGAA